MVAIVLQFESLSHFFGRTLVVVCHFRDGLREIAVYLLLGDTAERFVASVHADVLGLVEPAEHTHLREFGHPRQQDELQVCIGSFEHGVEGFQHVAVSVFQAGVHIEHVQNRFVVFINQYHGPSSGLLVRRAEHLDKPSSHVQPVGFGSQSVAGFPIRHVILQPFFQYPCLGEVGAVEVYMKYGIHIPIFFQLVYLQSLEQFLVPQEIVFQCRYQQTFSEASRTAQKINASFLGKLVNQVCFVYVDISVFDDAVKALYSYRVLHGINE